jgi:hypothetical protein
MDIERRARLIILAATLIAVVLISVTAKPGSQWAESVDALATSGIALLRPLLTTLRSEAIRPVEFIDLVGLVLLVYLMIRPLLRNIDRANEALARIEQLAAQGTEKARQ